MKTLSPHSCALPARLCPLLCGLWLWAAVLGPTAWAQDVSLKGPLGGWRNSAISEERDSAMHASYPSPPVDRGRQANRTLIEGRLRQVGSNRHPPRYVVNGINMPLYADDQGVFVKPWAFGPGSNSLEFKLPNGGKGRRVQFVEANPNKTRAKVRIVLGWDDPKAELDLHILTPDGEHAFWARPQLNAGGGLDVDSVDGGGPEIFSTATPVPGTYLIYVNYWGNFDSSGYNFDSQAHEKPMITAQVTIVTDENTLDEKQETLTLPMRRIGDLALVRALKLKEKS